MVTEISGAGLSHSVVAQTSTAAMRVVDMSRPEQSGLVTGVPISDKPASSTSQVAGAFSLLRSRQESLNQAAAVVREVNDTADKADQLLSKMEDDLVKVVKMYPPYPIDNPERISLLNSFGGLRRQIEALTFPPPEDLDVVGRALGAQEEANAAIAGKAESDLSELLDKEPIWDIPVLEPETASDAEVSKALEHVKAMQDFLEELQSGMWKDVVRFVSQAETPEMQGDDGTKVRALFADLGSEHAAIGRNARQLEAAAES